MMVGWRGESEQGLQQAMNVCRGEEILAARHQGNPLQGVIHGDGEMIARTHCLPREHHVAEALRLGHLLAAGAVEPGKPSRARHRRRHIEAQGIDLARGDAGGAPGRRQGAAGARITLPGLVGRCYGSRDLGADRGTGAEAGIEEPKIVEARQGRFVIGHMRRLASHGGSPGQAEPGEVGEDRAFIFGAAAPAIDILDAQEETPTRFARRAPGEKRGMGMTEMEAPCRARREAGDDAERIDHGCGSTIKFTLREDAPEGGPMARRFSRAVLEEALAELSRRDPDLARAHREAGTPQLRPRSRGFATLLNIILAQQLSTASANAIRRRLLERVGVLTTESFLALDDNALREIGFSRQKILYARGLAEAIAENRLDLARIHRMDDEDAIAALTAIKGFGRWSAEIYLLFALKRHDIWPVDDLAVVVAVQRLKGLASRPSRASMIEIAEPWRPWRSTAARLMWHYYSNAPT